MQRAVPSVMLTSVTSRVRSRSAGNCCGVPRRSWELNLRARSSIT